MLMHQSRTIPRYISSRRKRQNDEFDSIMMVQTASW